MTQTVMESITAIIPQTTTLEVTIAVPANVSSTATGSLASDTTGTPVPTFTSAIDFVTDTVLPNDPPDGTPLFASIQQSLLIDETTQIIEIATSVQVETPPETSTTDVQQTSEGLPTETTSEATSEATSKATSEATSEVASEKASKTISEATAESVTESATEAATETTDPTQSRDEDQLESDQTSTTTESLPETTADEFLIIDSGVAPTVSRTLRTRIRTSAIPTQSNEAGNPQPSLTTATLSNGIITTIGLGATAGSDKASETGVDVEIIGHESEEPPATPVVVGSIVGSVMGLSVLVFLLWFMKRRTIRRRRSTLLTPLDWPANGPGGEKYEIDNSSLGPTPRSTKLAAAVTFNAKKVGHKLRQSMSSLPQVDMNRGNSQYKEDDIQSQNVPGNSPYPADFPAQSQQGWWSGLAREDGSGMAVAQDVRGRDAVSRARTPSPSPFSDPNLMSANSLTPASLAPIRQARSDDPFTDASSPQPVGLEQLPQTRYIHNSHRANAQSMDRSAYSQMSMGPTQLVVPQQYCERDNIHSNPFDLDYDSRQTPSVSNVSTMPRHTARSSFYSTGRPLTSHSRAESFTSRYTSGVSAADPASFDLGRISKWGSSEGYPPPPPHSRSEGDGVVRHAG